MPHLAAGFNPGNPAEEGHGPRIPRLTPGPNPRSMRGMLPIHVVFARRFLVVLFWAIMMFWLLREEVMPERFGGGFRGYPALIGDRLERETWMRIRIDGAPAGYSRMAIETGGDDDPTAFLRLRHELRARLRLLGASHDIDSTLVVTLDAWNRMQEFTFSLSSRALSLQARGRRVERDIFRVVVRSGGASRRIEIRIPDDVMLFSPVAPPALIHLKPGHSVTMKTLDPTTFETTPVTVEALRKDTLVRDGKTIPTTVLRTTASGMQTRSWIDPDGIVQRVETPFGWIFEAVEADEAYEALRQSRRKEDTP